MWIGISSGRQFCMWGKLLTHLQAASAVTSWVWHDFRRTVVTHLAEAGVAESVADALLNHRQSANARWCVGRVPAGATAPGAARGLGAVAKYC